eukprot:scaffold2557_cov121-Cylindrotheca_fusiformis.AAC.31
MGDAAVDEPDNNCASSLEVGHHWVNFVFPVEDYGFVYTEGLYELYSHPEFVAFDVPKDKVDRVCAVMNFLADRLKKGHRVIGGQTLGSQGLVLGAQLIADEALHRRVWDTFMCRANEDCQILVLSPRYPEATDWGGFPDAPRGKTKLRNTIFAKLQGRRLRWFIDGNPSNLASWNAQPISHYDAFSTKDVETDWPKYLTKPETVYVRENMNHFASLYKPRPLKQYFTEEDEQEIKYAATSPGVRFTSKAMGVLYLYLSALRLKRHLLLLEHSVHIGSCDAVAYAFPPEYFYTCASPPEL